MNLSNLFNEFIAKNTKFSYLPFSSKHVLFIFHDLVTAMSIGRLQMGGFLPRGIASNVLSIKQKKYFYQNLWGLYNGDVQLSMKY